MSIGRFPIEGDGGMEERIQYRWVACCAEIMSSISKSYPGSLQPPLRIFFSGRWYQQYCAKAQKHISSTGLLSEVASFPLITSEDERRLIWQMYLPQ
jgi:hypothetical protein